MKQDVYVPINCGFYDQLEVFAMRKMKVDLTYTIKNKEVELNGAIIQNFTTQTDGEFLIGTHKNEPLKIRLDRLISVNGINIQENYGEACVLPTKK